MVFFAILSQYVIVFFAFIVFGTILPSTLLSGFSYFAIVYLCLCLASWITELTHHFFLTSTISPKNKAVLITGCDSGFGNALAEILHRNGFKVYACCLDPSSDGAQQLASKCLKSLEIIRLDVTDAESVKSAKKFVVENLGSSELWAVVNNAGVHRGFAIELSSMEDFEACMEVNALGPVRIAKAFLPLLRKSKGRVVNICSMAGRKECPFLGAYCMSKYACAAFSEVIKHELREFGIRVISVDPEFFRTPMTSSENFSKHLDALSTDIHDDIKADYDKKYIELAKNFLIFLSRNSSPDIKIVLNAMEDAVCLKYPSDRYTPCRNIITRLLLFSAFRIPDFFKDIFIIIVLKLFAFLKRK